VCATPLGHLDDASPRLLETLRTALLICAEDTRHTQKLLARFEIHTPLTAVQEHTSPAKIAALVNKLLDGDNLALVTDAGTPGVSDPGPALVRAALERGVTVSPIPGPCALAAALSVSGFDAQRFSFLGFLPRKPGKLRKTVASALARGETLVIYESPYRVVKLVSAIAELAPEVPLVVCRELTKRFEEILRGPAAEIAAQLAARGEQRGEFTLVVGNSKAVTFRDEPEEDENDTMDFDLSDSSPGEVEIAAGDHHYQGDDERN